MGPGGPMPSMHVVHKALLELAEGSCAIHDKRLAAVREIVKQSRHYSRVDGNLYKAHESLAEVWPEAVEGVR